MEYNDFLEQFDTKTFELLAKEYAKITSKKAQILQKSEQNLDVFMQKFEEFLTILMQKNKAFLRPKQAVFGQKNADKNTQLEKIISNFCKLYFALKNECFFSPYACKLNKEEPYENEIYNRAKELIFLSTNCLEKCHQNTLIDNIFLLVKLM